MKSLKALLVSLAGFGLLTAWAAPAVAFTCPVLFGEAQAAIDKATAAVKKLSGSKKAEVHMMLDDAVGFLMAARHNHEKPHGKMDHARAIGKAKSARGYAEAALILAGK